MKGTGFEEFYCDPPLTPAEHDEERDVAYAPHKPFHVRIEECVQRFRARRRLNSTRENIFSTYLRLGGIDTAPRAFQGVRNLDADDLTRDEARLLSATDVIYRGDQDLDQDAGGGACSSANPRFYNPNYAEHWDVDFTGVVSGFLSDQFMTSFGETAAKYREGVQVIRNFLTYVLRHDVCPEYEADVRGALQVCNVAVEEMPVISELCLQLPGAFNRSVSALCPLGLDPVEPDSCGGHGGSKSGNGTEADSMTGSGPSPSTFNRPVDEAVYLFDDWKAGSSISARLASKILRLVQAAWIAGVLPQQPAAAAAGDGRVAADAPPFARDLEFLARLAQGRVTVSPTRDRVYEVVRLAPPPPPGARNALADRVRGAFRHARENLLNGDKPAAGTSASLDQVEEVAEAIRQFEWGWGDEEKDDEEDDENTKGEKAKSDSKKEALHQKHADADCARTVGLCGFAILREVVLRDAFDRGIPATEEAPAVPVAALPALQAAAAAAEAATARVAGAVVAAGGGGGGGGGDGSGGSTRGHDQGDGEEESTSDSKHGDNDEEVLVLEEQVLALLRPGMKLSVAAASVEGRFVLVRQIRAAHPTYYRFLPQALMLRYKEPALNTRAAPSVGDAKFNRAEEDDGALDE